MLKFVDTKNGLPSHFPADDSKYFLPGMVAQFKRKLGKLVCGVSDGTSVIGVIDDIHQLDDSTIAACNQISIWNIKGMILTTDQFEIAQSGNEYIYQKDIPLYVNCDGLFTWRKQSDYLRPVAKLVKLCDNSITLEWNRNK